MIEDSAQVAGELKAAMRSFAKSVVIITAQLDGQRYAMAASAVDCLTLDPPSMLICVNRSASLWLPLAKGADFAINLLSAEQQHLAVHCSTGARGDDRFSEGAWASSEADPPILSDALASIVCRQQTSTTYGTHQLFIGAVRSVARQRDADPLVHSNGAYHRLASAA
ncbi:flavin reductase family protein [Sphingomonas soli]|uniref:flavin reductase family protein n=1 Tax=Sphingomonas soli TaxID=266127 RepID=UPI00082E7DFB|nr:flavin reductase family protein [Sphingomonas soli]